jgi:hypothetical protein
MAHTPPRGHSGGCVIMRASCLCGGITFEITGPVHGTRYCHCVHCRKFSGTAWAAWGLIETAHLAVGSLRSGLSKYDSGAGFRVFCTSCGSPLWYEPTALPQFRGIPLGVLDDEEVPGPQMHVWTRSKVSWAEISDGLPRYEILPQPGK